MTRPRTSTDAVWSDATEPDAQPYDVVVLGEALVQLQSTVPLRQASRLCLSFSGDALNAAAAAAAAGAKTALLTAIGEDELGEALEERIEALGIDAALVRRASDRSNGAYVAVSDADGDREFIYWRAESAASTLSLEDVRRHETALRSARSLVTSGVVAALSPSCRQAVVGAARLVAAGGGFVTYDPNFRRRLTTVDAARDVLREIAPLAALLTPSCPSDASALLETTVPWTAVERGRLLGAGTVAVTSGADAVTVGGHGERLTIGVPRSVEVEDATGAGDVFTGTVTARVALGDDLRTALRLGVAAATLSTQGRGGTGYLPSLEESRRWADKLEVDSPVGVEAPNEGRQP